MMSSPARLPWRAGSRAMAASSQRIVAERSGLVVVGGFYLMVTGVLAGLWSVAASVNGGSIVGYSSVALVWYVATTEAGTISVPMKLIENIGDDIVSERIVTEMLRPVSMLWMRVAGEVGQMLPRLAICVVFGTAYALLVGGAPPDVGTLPLAAVALLLAVTLNLVSQHVFAGAAFWIRDAQSAWFLYQKLVFILGGMLLPLEVLPHSIETVARFMPFMAMAYVPARLAAGYSEPELILVQLGWLAVVSALAAYVFARGERRVMEARS